jgi:hypothetical protein
MDRTNEYRAKAFELLSLAEGVNDPERQADMLRFARMSLSEPIVQYAVRLRVTQVSCLGESRMIR